MKLAWCFIVLMLVVQTITLPSSHSESDVLSTACQSHFFEDLKECTSSKAIVNFIRNLEKLLIRKQVSNLCDELKSSAGPFLNLLARRRASIVAKFNVTEACSSQIKERIRTV